MHPTKLLARNGAKGFFNVNFTVRVSTLSTLSSELQSNPPSVSRLGSDWILTVVTTSLEVIGLPSLHLAPDFSLTVQTVPSDETCGIPSARSGTTFRFLSAEYRFGNMNASARAEGMEGLRVGIEPPGESAAVRRCRALTARARAGREEHACRSCGGQHPG